MNKPFRMRVQEVFHFEDGTTVFAGEITEGPRVIEQGEFELTVDGRVLGIVKLDGERSKGRVPHIRSVSTSQRLEFDSDVVKGQEVHFAILEHV